MTDNINQFKLLENRIVSILEGLEKNEDRLNSYLLKNRKEMNSIMIDIKEISSILKDNNSSAESIMEKNLLKKCFENSNGLIQTGLNFKNASNELIIFILKNSEKIKRIDNFLNKENINNVEKELTNYLASQTIEVIEEILEELEV